MGALYFASLTKLREETRDWFPKDGFGTSARFRNKSSVAPQALARALRKPE